MSKRELNGYREFPPIEDEKEVSKSQFIEKLAKERGYKFKTKDNPEIAFGQQKPLKKKAVAHHAEESEDNDEWEIPFLMAYFISKTNAFMREMAKAVERHFGDHAEVIWEGETIKVSILSGFDKQIKSLTEEELEAGVIGGGYVEEINGKEFVLSLDKADKLDV